MIRETRPMLLSISRTASNEGDYMSVVINEADGRRKLVRLRVGLAKFMDALTGRAEVECQGDVYSDEEPA